MGFEVEKYRLEGGHRIYKIYKGCVGGNYLWGFIWPWPKKKSFKSPPSCQALPVYLANTGQKVGYPITNIMLSRNADHCRSMLYILSLSSICMGLDSWIKILGLIISMAI
jgi:hypothetical protein